MCDTMNRVLRGGAILFAMLVITAAGALAVGGLPAEHATHYPVTVRMWLDDAFIGGVMPVAPGVTGEATVLELLAAGNDLVYVGDDAPRCPVWTTVMVSPAPGTPPSARTYNATIHCATHAYTLQDMLERAGP